MPRPPLPLELRRRLTAPDAREVYADVGLVTGRVLDHAGNPVHGADVRMVPGGPATLSAMTGDFALFAPAGRVSVQVSAPGFIPVTIDPFEVEPREDVPCDVTLRPRVAIPLPRSRVEGRLHRESVR